MRNEARFNKTVQELIDLNPQKEAIQVIQQYRSQSGGICYYEALEDLGRKVGITFQIVEIINPKTGNVTGYRPAIVYQEGNPNNGKEWTKELMDVPFKSPNKCYDYIARQHVYVLMDTPNLASHVFRESVDKAR